MSLTAAALPRAFRVNVYPDRGGPVSTGKVRIGCLDVLELEEPCSKGSCRYVLLPAVVNTTLESS